MDVFLVVVFFFVHFTGFQMDLYSFVIGPSDAQATSALIAISLLIAYLSLNVFYSFTNITLSLLCIFGEHPSVSPIL